METLNKSKDTESYTADHTNVRPEVEIADNDEIWLILDLAKTASTNPVKYRNTKAKLIKIIAYLRLIVLLNSVNSTIEPATARRSIQNRTKRFVAF